MYILNISLSCACLHIESASFDYYIENFWVFGVIGGDKWYDVLLYFVFYNAKRLTIEGHRLLNTNFNNIVRIVLFDKELF